MDFLIKKRDVRLDVLKGIAITLVLLGHILQVGYTDYTDTLLFRVIWSLQMPLFMVVSGYLGGEGKLGRIAQHTRAYIIPFFSCFLIKILVFAHRIDIVRWIYELPFCLEDSLWYLFVLFVLSTIHILSIFIADKLDKKREFVKHSLYYSLFFAIFLIPAILFSIFVSPSFLGSKLILYYSVFFFAGQMWRVLSDVVVETSEITRTRLRIALDVLTIPICAAYLWFVSHIDMYGLNDGAGQMLLRLLISALGAFLVIKTTFATFRDGARVGCFFARIGRYTLEIYYLQFLCIFHAMRFLAPKSELIHSPVFSPEGLITLILYYFVLLGLCFLLMTLIHSSPYLSFVIFGKGLPKANRVQKILPDSSAAESEQL